MPTLAAGVSSLRRRAALDRSRRTHPPGVITESLAYSTLQSGPEFARWLAERGRAGAPDIPEPVQADRVGDRLHVRFNRPQRHNAFSTDMRAALLEALDVARLDRSITEVVLTGNGASFCSGEVSSPSDHRPTMRLLH